MKKSIILFIFTMICISCVSCSGKDNSENEVENLSIANPFVSVASSDAFKDLGVSIEAPQNSTNIAYYTINKKTAQIDFTLDGVSYTYRATKEKLTNMHGVYDKVVNTEQFFIEDVLEVNIDTTDTDITIATWAKSGIYYSLTANTVLDNDSVLNLIQKLMNP